MAQMEDFMFKLKLCVLWLNFINCYYVFSWSTRWILKLSRSFSDCFKSFSNTSFRSKGAVTSLKWSYNQYVACYYNQYARWIHCMRIFVFVVIRLKFLTWASKPTGLSPPIVLSCSDWLPFKLGKVWESRYSGHGMSRDPNCVIDKFSAGHVRRGRHGSGNCRSSGAGYWLTELRASWWKWVRIGPIICSGWTGYWTTTHCCLAANHPRVLYKQQRLSQSVLVVQCQTTAS